MKTFDLFELVWNLVEFLSLFVSWCFSVFDSTVVDFDISVTPVIARITLYALWASGHLD